MKKTIGAFVILFALCGLFMGYYESLDDARIKYNPLNITRASRFASRISSQIARTQSP